MCPGLHETAHTDARPCGCSAQRRQRRPKYFVNNHVWRRTMKNLLVRFVQEDEGQDLVEYALLITFIALACIIGMQNLGTAINNRYNSISTSLAS
jgi:pilus assembly protein Flp/PilA